MSKKRKVATFLGYLLFTIFITEVLLRVILAIRIGPDLLFYGTKYCKISVDQNLEKKDTDTDFMETKHNVSKHENKGKNYSKYFPNQKRVDVDKDGVMFNVTINSNGFRGKEINKVKRENVIRIAFLGTSAIFGYHDRDNETCPYYLEKVLNEKLDELDKNSEINSFEVINLGIPHLRLDNIYSLFRHEALPLNPDIVILYAAMTDVARQVYEFHEEYEINKLKKSLPKRIYKKIERESPQYLLTANLLFNYLPIDTGSKLSYQFYKELLAGINKESYFHYLSKLADECGNRGIQFFVITQQAQSTMLSEEKLKEITYDQEVEIVRSKLLKNPVDLNEIYLLIHSDTMDELRLWAEKNNVQLIDGIKALDNDRNHILHWIHLMPKANYILANEIAGEILQSVNSNRE